MNPLDKLKEDEKALEEKLFGVKKVAETTAPSETTTKEEVEAKAPTAEEGLVAQPAEPEAEKPKTEEIEDWEKRYKNLRASRDSKLYDAQQALATAQATIATLQQQLTELEKGGSVPEVDIFVDTLTDEEKEALGETTVEAMRKTAKAAAASGQEKLQKELAELKAEKVRMANQAAKAASNEAYGTFLARLGSLVPDFQAIDKDPGFIKYCQGTDIDGSTIADNFRSAESRGDARTIALYMKDYIASKNPRQKAKDSLENKIVPTGNGNATPVVQPDNNKGIAISMKEVNAHYQKYSKGGYKGKHNEYLAMEARIDKAAAAGLITG